MDRIFNNTTVAFAHKTTKELRKARIIFLLLSKRYMVRVGMTLLKWSKQIRLQGFWYIERLVYRHFCAGADLMQTNSVVQQLKKYGVSAYLNYAIEDVKREIEFDNNCDKVIELLLFSKDKESLPFGVFKPTAFGDSDIYEKISNGDSLSEEENQAWQRTEARFRKCCKVAHDEGLSLLIDAEESWLQIAVDRLVMDLMKEFNTKTPVVFNTVQLYLKSSFRRLQVMHQSALKSNHYLGLKLVRGAYMEKERSRAKFLETDSPVFAHKVDTDNNFDQASLYCLKNIDAKMALFFGTHNEASTYMTIEVMKSQKIKNNDKRVWFSQLYGMSDHISYNLAAKGYNVVKFLPFGPMDQVMPYLIRRAEENSSVPGQTGREIQLVDMELKRRRSKLNGSF
ncbi:MAG: proline dehydrogenase family protein [Flavobacteriaceae bacterium]|nr:proline dehydrogenase family protein [Flavobacteriaceae bacterium]